MKIEKLHRQVERSTTLGDGTAISDGGTPGTGCGTPFWPVPAEFTENRCKNTKPNLVKMSPLKSALRHYCNSP